MIERVVLWFAIAVGLAGCLETSTTRCGDRVCPAGLVCFEPLTACVRQAQITACEGLPDDADCSFEGAPAGRCTQGVCAPVACGNDTVDLGEACDDGNVLSGDGCSSDCRSNETCGNNIIDVAAGEACDDGNTDPMDGCQPNCELPTCGDGIVDTGEICDDGNNANADGCNARCTSNETCQNGVVDPAKNEDCDDSNNNGGDGCSPSCHFEVCGNGIPDVGEVCDDGNNVSGDGCSSNCKSNETCGNGIPDLFATPAEGCDEGGGNSNGPNATCRTDCQPRRCGDGTVDNIFGEACEQGVPITGADCTTFGFYAGTLSCNSDCSFNTATCMRTCGDGTLDDADGEECDPGPPSAVFPAGVDCSDYGFYSNAAPTCTSICRISPAGCTGGKCGDGNIDAAELCDGNQLGGVDCQDLGFYDPGIDPTCNAACRFDTALCTGGYCGDHLQNGPEFCDGRIPSQTCADLGQDMGELGCSGYCTPGLFPDCSKRDISIESSATTSSLWDVFVASDTSIFAVGDGGTILHYDGQGWSMMSSPAPGADLKAVWGTSPTNVYAGGSVGTLLHYDGTSWTQLSIGLPTTHTIFGIHGTGPNDIWLGARPGSGSAVVHWDGFSWTTTSFGIGINIQKVFTPTPGTVFAIGLATVHRLSGGTWTSIRPLTGSVNYSSIFARSATEVYVGWTASGSAEIERYDGNAWNFEQGFGNGSVTDIAANASELYATVVPSSGDVQLWRRGTPWMVAATTTPRLDGLDMTPSGELVAVGGQGALRRLSVWTRSMSTSPITGVTTWNDIWAVDEGEQFVVGSGGTIAHRVAGGAWTTMTSNTTSTLSSVWGANASRVFAVGAGGTIRLWDGVGPGWITMTTNPATTTAFTGVWGSGPNDVFAVGGNGTSGAIIYHYDGNVSNVWTAMSGFSGNAINAVAGAGPSEVYAVTFGGLVYRYNGSIWQTVVIPGASTLYDVVARGPNDAFAVSGGGRIWRSTDAGATWMVMTTPSNADLLAVDARGPRGDVYAVGVGGELLHFDDERWTKVKSVVANDLTGVSLTANHMFAVGTIASGVAGFELHHNKGTTERCGNEWDDDADGLHDCADPDCTGSAYCSKGGACNMAGSIACGATLTGNNFTGSPFPDDYGCTAGVVGPEVSYRFSVAAQTTVTATLNNYSENLNLVVVEEQASGGCDTQTCAGTMTPGQFFDQVVFTAEVGKTYQLVVDGVAGAASTFSLSLSCQ